MQKRAIISRHPACLAKVASDLRRYSLDTPEEACAGHNARRFVLTDVIRPECRRLARKQLGYTQAELAEAAGVGVSYLAQLEGGKETAELGKALHLLSILGINLFAEERG